MIATADWNCLLGSKLTGLIQDIMLRSNCYSKTVNVTARMLKCIFTQDRNSMRSVLTTTDIQTARIAQFMVSMGPSYAALEKGHLDNLRPFEENGILYIRGRCGQSLLELLGVSKLPVLARSTRLAELIMWESHCEDHRMSSSDVLTRSRQRAWIIWGRYLARFVCKSCPRCKLAQKRLSAQLMADIPAHQLKPCPPFTYISLDFAGPYKVKAMGNSRAFVKSWGLVIVCQNTRAIRMYATAGYSTDDFLTAFLRFTSNHGNPLLIVSDSGSQLIRAGKVIEGGDPTKLDWERIQEGAAKNGTDWKSVEPGCQWRNGLAEAAVKLVKSTLELTLAGHTTLTYAELDTIFASVSNIVNQRPIAVRGYTEEDLHAITPNDLLLGRSKNAVPGVTYGTNDLITRRQEVLCEIEDLWWKQWGRKRCRTWFPIVDGRWSIAR